MIDCKVCLLDLALSLGSQFKPLYSAIDRLLPHTSQLWGSTKADLTCCLVSTITGKFAATAGARTPDTHTTSPLLYRLSWSRRKWLNWPDITIVVNKEQTLNIPASQWGLIWRQAPSAPGPRRSGSSRTRAPASVVARARTPSGYASASGRGEKTGRRLPDLKYIMFKNII